MGTISRLLKKISLAKEPYKTDRYSAKKNPMFSKSLLIVATKYTFHVSHTHAHICAREAAQPTHDFLKTYVSFAEQPTKMGALLQKKPIFSRSLQDTDAAQNP